ncbi:MAG TPA: response regulator [Candidatus Thermoplasmatota archaeon]|nr:response regulator [Candidatus Thermoplasmatota archaeon]
MGGLQGEGPVLVLDESDAVRAKLGDVLAERGLPSVAGASPREAEILLGAQEPRLVFLEFLGETAAGFDLLDRALARHPRAPFVLVTAEPPESPLVRRAVRMGVFAVLHKPLRRDDVRRVLDEAEAERADLVRLR